MWYSIKLRAKMIPDFLREPIDIYFNASVTITAVNRTDFLIIENCRCSLSVQYCDATLYTIVDSTSHL